MVFFIGLNAGVLWIVPLFLSYRVHFFSHNSLLIYFLFVLCFFFSVFIILNTFYFSFPFLYFINNITFIIDKKKKSIEPKMFVSMALPKPPTNRDGCWDILRTITNPAKSVTSNLDASSPLISYGSVWIVKEASGREVAESLQIQVYFLDFILSGIWLEDYIY